MPVAVGVRAIRSGSRLERILASGAFAVTAEIAPPASADGAEIRENASRYRGAVDACNVTDCTRARVHISSLAAAAIVIQEGVEPVMQMVLRDRNRIALQADLLGAAALGVRNVLCLWGDPPSAGNERDAKGVFDMKTEDMIEMFRNLRDAGTLRGGDKVKTPPKVFIGAAAVPRRNRSANSERRSWPARTSYRPRESTTSTRSRNGCASSERSGSTRRCTSSRASSL